MAHRIKLPAIITLDKMNLYFYRTEISHKVSHVKQNHLDVFKNSFKG